MAKLIYARPAGQPSRRPRTKEGVSLPPNPLCPTGAEVDPFTAALLQAVLLLLLVRWLDVWEREPIWILAVLAVWGAVGAGALASWGNGAIDAALPVDIGLVWGAAISAPVVEEVAKGLALVAAVFASRWAGRRWGLFEFDGPTDGMVYGMAVGLGFAFSENNLYFISESYYAENVEAGCEVLGLREGFWNLGTLSHGVWTGVFGAGLGLATWSRTRMGQVGFPLLGLGVAMLLHTLHNGLAELVLVLQYGFDTTAAYYSGERLPQDLLAQLDATSETAITVLDVITYGSLLIFVLALFAWTRYQRRVLAYELAAEAEAGQITREDSQLLLHYRSRLSHYARLARHGRFDALAALRRFQHQLGELAFLKWRLRHVGGNPQSVVAQREKIRRLGSDRSWSEYAG